MTIESPRGPSLGHRLVRWFPRWTGTRLGTCVVAAIYFLAATAVGVGLFSGIDGLSRLIAVVYGPIALIASARHVVGALRWSDRPVPRRARRQQTDVGMEIVRDGSTRSP